MQHLRQLGSGGFFPDNLNELSTGQLWHWAATVFPRRNSYTQILHTLICRWRGAAYRDRHGTRWLVQTAEELVEHLRYSKKTIYRALKAFEQMGLIIKRQAPHIYRNDPGRQHVNWIALIMPGREGYTGRRRPGDRKGQNVRVCMIGTKCPDHTPSSQVTSGEDTPSRSFGGGVEKESSQVDRDLTDHLGKPGRHCKQRSRAMKAADAVKHAKARIDEPKTGPLKPKEAVHIYQRAHKDAWPNEPMPPATAKLTAMMRQVLEKLRAAGHDDQYIRKGLHKLVLRWVNFQQEVKRRIGRKVSERPDLAVILFRMNEVLLFIVPSHYDQPREGLVKGEGGFMITAETAEWAKKLFGED